MSVPLRLLLLEDNVSDAELILYTLRRAGFELDCCRVECESDFRSAIQTPLDVILADYNLPQFDALRALDIIAKRRVDVPVIIISGVIGEDIAVEAMRLGAADYLLKDRLGRLGQAVSTVLETVRLRKAKILADESLRAREKAYAELVHHINERRQAEAALKAANERFALATRAASMGVWEYAVSADQLVWDEQMFRLYAVDEAAFAYNYDAWLQLIHPKDRLCSHEEMQLALTEEKEYVTEFRVVWPNGSVRHIRSHGYVDRGDNGAALRMIGVNYDITDQKNAEEELRRSLSELAASNSDLEQFAHVASHDLQEPLRVVSNYMHLLSRRYKDQLDSEGYEFIEFALDGVERMKSLINDLLVYARIGNQKEIFRTVDLNRTIRQVQIDLSLLIQEKRAQVTYDRLPNVQADKTQMAQLLQNLVGNGLKFNENNSPRIHISVQTRRGDWLFCVQDNGIGLDPEAAESIFVIFQRLNRRSEYPGTGIGLSICKKIVNRHGGKIWVESEPGKGAKFYFTLPIRDVVN